MTINYHYSTNDFKNDRQILDKVLDNLFSLSEKLHGIIVEHGPSPERVERVLKIDRQIAYVIQVKASLIKKNVKI